eukprot:667428-Amphidinium_carterae.1
MPPVPASPKVEIKTEGSTTRKRSFSIAMSSSQQVIPLEIDSTPEKKVKADGTDVDAEIERELREFFGDTPTQ